ncbi:aspartate aminotransferase family protein [Geoglobus sp.]
MSELIEREKKVFMQFFSRYPIAVEGGEGCWLYDESGRKYLDLIAGIACISVGHANEYVAERVSEQLKKLVHVSNLFYTRPQIELAEKLREISGLDRFFFTNSGTESVEAALKVARKATGRKKFVAFTNGFHGRTMGALSVTWKEKFRQPFEPLVKPVSFAEFNSVESLEQCVDRDTAAVILEPIQGEAGIFPASTEFMKRIFELKEEYDYLVIFDEVQTGFGRTGRWFAKDMYGATPDIITMAKAMGNGFPVGAIGVTEDVHRFIEKGDHGSTFGGNPLACTASLATIEYIERNDLLENAVQMGERFRRGLQELEFVSEVRGAGLMIGVTVDDAREFVRFSMERGVLVNATSDRNVRILPPLTIGRDEVDFALSVFSRYRG